MNNCENAEFEMKVTSSQQMMSIGDFLLPINGKQKEPRFIQCKSVHKIQPKQTAVKLQTLNNATEVLLNEKEKEHLPGKKDVTENIT